MPSFDFIKDGYKKKSLQWTISLSFSAISIISIAAMAIAFYTHSINTIRENTIKENHASVLLDASLPACIWYEHRGYRTIEHKRWDVKNGAVLIYEIMEKRF